MTLSRVQREIVRNRLLLEACLQTEVLYRLLQAELPGERPFAPWGRAIFRWRDLSS